jgi:hypothetical protein
MHHKRYIRETCLLSSPCKSANVCIRIWCLFILEHEKAHLSTCWKLVREVASAPFSLAGSRFRNFSSLTSSSGEKSWRRKKSPEASCAKRPDLRAPGYPTPLSFDFDSIDNWSFSEQMCEQQYIYMPMISGFQAIARHTCPCIQSDSPRTMQEKKGSDA